MSLRPMLGCDSEVVHPPAVTVETDHRRRHELVVDGSDEKQLGLLGELAGDVPVRVVPRSNQPGLDPQGDHGIGVGFGEGAQVHPFIKANRRPPRRVSACRQYTC